MNRSRLTVPVVAALLWVAPPVQARTDKGACPRGSGCVWDQTNFQGSMAQVPRKGCIDDDIRSAVNTSDEAIAFFTGSGCVGLQAGTLQPGEEAPQINAGSAGAATGDCSDNPVDSCGGEVPSPSN
jgi:hypothetical protein